MKVAVITGTNSNLGLNLAYRLLERLPAHEDLTLVVTSRTLSRVRECIEKINRFHSQLERSGVLSFEYLLVDFTDMVSILDAIKTLKDKYTAINYVFINAAQGVYDGIDWIGAIKEICTDPIEGVTNPHYKIQRVGVKSRDGMGLVFEANVFGPYYFIQKLLPILEKGTCRVIWISSLMGEAKYLNPDDLQLLESDASYEGSKRLVDLLHFATYKDLNKRGIKQYLTHPGIFASASFFKYLNIFTYLGMMFVFYIARWMGSPWHNIDGYKAACAPIDIAVKDDSLLPSQDIKYGSATTRKGVEYIKEEKIKVDNLEKIKKYFETLRDEWDEKLKDQVKNTRIPM